MLITCLKVMVAALKIQQNRTNTNGQSLETLITVNIPLIPINYHWARGIKFLLDFISNFCFDFERSDPKYLSSRQKSRVY